MTVDLGKLRVGDKVWGRIGRHTVLEIRETVSNDGNDGAEPYHDYWVALDDNTGGGFYCRDGLLEKGEETLFDIIEIIPAKSDLERELEAGTAFEGFWGTTSGGKVAIRAYYPEQFYKLHVSIQCDNGDWYTDGYTLGFIKGRWKEPAKVVTKEVQVVLSESGRTFTSSTSAADLKSDREIFGIIASRKITIEFTEGEFDE